MTVNRSNRPKRGELDRPGGLRRRQEGKDYQRHIIVDTQGLVLNAVHPAGIQDRDGALLVLTGLGLLFPWLMLIWADGAYKGKGLDALFADPRPWRLEVVKRSDDTKELEVLPHRWVVEHTPKA